MNETQHELLRLMKEIDEICEKNDIEYFLDWGTALGAVRHNGFIPWDNDADIVMTEENYNKFVECVNSTTKETGRMVQSYGVNPEYPRVFGRYMDINTTSLKQSCSFWNEKNAGAGNCIDVFTLIPLPKDEKEKKRIADLFLVYDEFVNESLRHHGNRSKDVRRTYKLARLFSHIVGRKTVINYMEKQIYNRNHEDFEEYLLNTGSTRVPLTVKKEWLEGGARRFEFEDTELPVVNRYAECFRSYYGNEYYVVPRDNDRKVIPGIHSRTLPFDVYVKDYMRMLDANTIKATRRKFKEVHVKEGWKKKDVRLELHEFRTFKVKEDILHNIKKNNLDLVKLLENNEGDVLNELFRDYYMEQFTNEIKYWPVIIDLPEDILYVALMNLINQHSDYGKAQYVINSYLETTNRIPDKLCEIRDLLDILFIIQSAFDYGEYDRGIKALEEGEASFSSNKEIKIARIMYDVHFANDEDEYQKCLAKIDALLEKHEDWLDLLKYKGDIYWKQNKLNESMELYEKVYNNTRNGMIRLDIEKKRKEF